MSADIFVQRFSRELESRVCFGPMQPVSYVEFQRLRPCDLIDPVLGSLDVHNDTSRVLHHHGIFEGVPCQDTRPILWEYYTPSKAQEYAACDVRESVRRFSPYYDLMWLARTVDGGVCLVVLPIVGGSHYHVIDRWSAEVWEEIVDVLAWRLQRQEFRGAYDLDAFCVRVAALRHSRGTELARLLTDDRKRLHP